MFLDKISRRGVHYFLFYSIFNKFIENSLEVVLCSSMCVNLISLAAFVFVATLLAFCETPLRLFSLLLLLLLLRLLFTLATTLNVSWNIFFWSLDWLFFLFGSKIKKMKNVATVGRGQSDNINRMVRISDLLLIQVIWALEVMVETIQ